MTARARGSVVIDSRYGDRVLSGARGEVVDAAFHREHVRRGAEPAQRRGAHRRLRHEMMQDALGRNVVERLAVARAAAAIRLGHVVRRRLGQADRAEHSAPSRLPPAPGRKLCVGAPDLLRPVDGFAGVVEQRTDLDHHRRCLRLVDELFLAPPAHADRLAGLLHGNDGRVGRGIVGAVVAVAAGALHVVHDDRRRVRASGCCESAARSG